MKESLEELEALGDEYGAFVSSTKLDAVIAELIETRRCEPFKALRTRVGRLGPAKFRPPKL